jgi:uncharacterized delta-60 repeat protein
MVRSRAATLAVLVATVGGCASILGIESQTFDGDAGDGGGGGEMDVTTHDAPAMEASSGGADSGPIGVVDSGPDSGPGFTLSAQASLTLQQGASAQVNVMVARTGGFADAITVTVSGLPAGATANPLTITNGTASGPLTIVVGNATPQSVSNLSIDGVAANGTVSASTTMDLVVRGPPGSVDQLFGNQGIVSGFLTTTNFGTFDAAAIDGTGNILILIDSQLGGGQVLVIRILPDGTLDPSFGTAGIATVPNTGVAFDAIFPLSTGEILLCGLSQNGSPWTDEMVRLTSAGAVDTSFSPDGGIGNSFTRTDGQPYVFTLDSLGRVVETGFTGNAAGFLLTRRTATGPLDTTFDAGFASTVGGPGGATVIQPDGMIVATFASTKAPYGMGMVRTDGSGALDPTFGTGGIVPATGPGDPSALLLQSNGLFVAGGLVFSSGGLEQPGGFVARYLANGTLDPTYGYAGVATVTPGNVWALAQQSDDDVIAVGYPWPIGDAGGPTNDLWLERLTAGGLPDVAFGNGGVVTTSVGVSGEICEGEFVAIQVDGRIVVVAATMQSPGVYDFEVTRYWP